MRIKTSENQIDVSSPAKVNLFLELTSKRNDGFHEIETVMSNVSLFDRIRFRRRASAASQLKIKYPVSIVNLGETDDIPTDHRNLIIKAIDLVRTTALAESSPRDCKFGFDILLQKNIPSAAGLGGASGNAAAALVAANWLWKLNWPIKKLSQLGAQLGSDIPFFLYGCTAICRGRGEKIQPIPAPASVPIVIAKPGYSLSTASVFQTVRLSGESRSSSRIRAQLNSDTKNLSDWESRSHHFGKLMFNRLQEFAEPLTDQIGRLAHEFSRLNCIGHQLSGSGSSYFGVFSSAKVARVAATCLSSRLPDVRIFCSHTI